MSVPTCPSVIETARELLDAGCSYGSAANEVGVDRKTLSRRLPGYRWNSGKFCEAHGSFHGISRALTPAQLSDALALLRDGCSYQEAARSVGCSTATLTRRFPGYGWSPGDGIRFVNTMCMVSMDELLPNHPGERYMTAYQWVRRRTRTELVELASGPGLRGWRD